MSTYGMEIYNSVGRLIVSSEHWLTRLVHSGFLSGNGTYTIPGPAIDWNRAEIILSFIPVYYTEYLVHQVWNLQPNSFQYGHSQASPATAGVGPSGFVIFYYK